MGDPAGRGAGGAAVAGQETFLVGDGALGGPELLTALAGAGEVRRLARGEDALAALARGARPRAVLALIPPGAAIGPVELRRGLGGLLGPAAPPELVLVPQGREDLLATALEAGAADALLLPVRPNDLLARLRARARLSEAAAVERPRAFDPEVMAARPPRDLCQEGGFLFGGRLVVSQLAQGPLTRVLLAVRLEDASLAALKLLDPEVAAQDPDWLARFEREQRLLIGIEEPHLVRIRDAGTLQGVPYLDMDYSGGETLDRLIDHQGRLSPCQALSIATQVARGLSALHARRIVHRDVKPENVLVEPGGKVRLCDFGLSKPQDDAGLTHEGEILGTVAFIAPEVLAGATPGPQADLYALGVTLYEMLTGEDALEPGLPPVMFKAAQRGAAQARALERLEGDARALVSRLLAVDPRDRFRDAAAAVEALENTRG
mgnify:CR=1 FL=1